MNKFLRVMKAAFAVMALICLCLALFVACDRTPEDNRETFTVSVKTYNTVLGTVAWDKESYKDGDTVAVTVTPKQGQELRRLVVNGQEVTEQCTFADGVYTYTFTIDKNSELEVAFKSVDKWVFTVEEYNEIAGTVTLSPENQEEYLKGELVTVNVEANEGYAISSVTLNGEEITLVDGSYSFNIMSNSTLAVEFEPTVTYTVTVNGLVGEDDEELATVQFSPAKTEYATNETVTVTLSVVQGYILTAATVNDEDVTESFNSRGGSYVLTITQNMTVDFVFDVEDLSIIQEITADEFEAQISRNGKVLVYFGADWCTWCEPTYESLQEVAGMGRDLKIVKIDYGPVPNDENYSPEQTIFYTYSQQFASGSIIPFLMLFEDGQPVAGVDASLGFSVETILNFLNNPSNYIK